jgi:hypothetical protein
MAVLTVDLLPPDFLSWEKHRRVKRASGQGFLGEREGSKL